MISRIAFPAAALVFLASVGFAQPPVRSAPIPQPGPPGPPRTGDYVWPDRLQNAQVLPADMGADRLRRTMVGFARQLGVRCGFCHVGAEGASLNQMDFVSDANPHKNIARGMLRMTQRINGELLPAMLGPVAQGQPARVTCFTCHRGSPQPATQPPPPPGAPGVPPPPPEPPHHHAGERG